MDAHKTHTKASFSNSPNEVELTSESAWVIDFFIFFLFLTELKNHMGQLKP